MIQFTLTSILSSLWDATYYYHRIILRRGVNQYINNITTTMEEGGGKDRPANKAPAKKKKGGSHGIRGKRKYTRNARTGSEQNTSSVVRAPGNDESITTRTPTPAHSIPPRK